MADDFLYGASRQLNRNQARQLQNAHQNNASLQERISEQEVEIDQGALHYVAMEAERDLLMAMLDKAYGKDKNPARQPAYSESSKARIPAGARKGQRVSVADKAFYEAFSSAFQKNYAHEYNCDWKDMLLDNWIE